MNLKAQLKAHLNHCGLTASQLARKSGVPNQTLSDWLAGRRPRNLDQVQKVAAALNTTIDHLVYGDGVDQKSDQALSVDDLLGDRWVTGTFEVKFRRLKK